MNFIKTLIYQTNFIEWLGFFSSLIYVFLASKLYLSCWIFAIIASISYSILSFQFLLYFESFLQLFYVIMAIYAWVFWNRKIDLQIQSYTIKKHIVFFLPLLVISISLGWIFKEFTNQYNPFIDSSIFIFSLFATYLLSKKNIENWIYFIIIDIFASYLYFKRNLYLTGFLYIFYTILAIYGYWSWHKIKRSFHRS